MMMMVMMMMIVMMMMGGDALQLLDHSLAHYTHCLLFHLLNNYKAFLWGGHLIHSYIHRPTPIDLW